jgi:hypothetical protein
LRAPRERFGGGGNCSGSSAARGLRGEIGALSDILFGPDPDLRACGAFRMRALPSFARRYPLIWQKGEALAVSGL